MKRKSILFEFMLSFLAILVALFTGVSLIGKPLRLVDVLTILALGIAGGAALTKAIIGLRREGRRNTGAPGDSDASQAP